MRYNTYIRNEARDLYRRGGLSFWRYLETGCDVSNDKFARALYSYCALKTFRFPIAYYTNMYKCNNNLRKDSSFKREVENDVNPAAL